MKSRYKHATALTLRWFAAVALMLVFGPCLLAQSVTVLSVEEVRRLALEFNRDYLAAQEDVVKAEGEIVKARAGALPEINLNASYGRNFITPSFFITGTDPTDPGGESSTMEFKTSFKNNFVGGISLRQSIWQGGKVVTAWQIAKLYRKYALEISASVQANVIYEAEVLYYMAILQRARLAVLEKLLESNTYNLEVVEQLYSQGQVSEFELLRAKVEKANVIPEMLAAESGLRLSDKRLKSFLGIDLGEKIELVNRVHDTSLVELPAMTTAIDSALQKRPEMLQSVYLEDITKKAVRVAKADYWPSLELVSNYDWSSQSDEISLSQNNTQSLSAGLVLSFPIFSGFERSGNVSQARADHVQARLAAEQTTDNVTLEVEEAYDLIVQARKALEVVGETIAQAEEGLNIANLRYESGIGTQLEVLSAQTALTDARRAEAEALFFFREARARLKRDATIDLEGIGNIE